MAILGNGHWTLSSLGCIMRPPAYELKRSVYEPTEALDPGWEYEKGAHGSYLLIQGRWRRQRAGLWLAGPAA